MTAVTTVLLGLVVSAAVTACAGDVSRPGNGQLIERDGKVIGSRDHRPAVQLARYFYSRPSAAARLRCGRLVRIEPRTDQQEA
jgi:K+-transporting ATPase c subunit